MRWPRTDWLNVTLFALDIGVVLAMVALALYSPPAWPAEYEILAERTGAALRTDEPNVRRIRDGEDEPFASRADCESTIPARSIDLKLGTGWRLRCRPVEVPLPRFVVVR